MQTVKPITVENFADILMQATLSKAGLANRVLSRDGLLSQGDQYINVSHAQTFTFNLADWDVEEAYAVMDEIGYAVEDRFFATTFITANKIDRQPTIYESFVSVLQKKAVVEPPMAYLMGSDVYQDILAELTANAPLSSVMDTVAKHEYLLQGWFGSCLGADLFGDMFRLPEHKVLNRGTFIAVGRNPGTIHTEDSQLVWEGTSVTWQRTTTIRYNKDKFAVIGSTY